MKLRPPHGPDGDEGLSTEASALGQRAPEGVGAVESAWRGSHTPELAMRNP